MICSAKSTFDVILTGFIGASAPAVAGTITQFTDRNSWLAAVGNSYPGFTLVDETMDGEAEDGTVHQSITLAGSNIVISATQGVTDENDDFNIRNSSAQYLSDDGTQLFYGSSIPGGMTSLSIRVSHFPVTGPGDPFYASAQEFAIYLPEPTTSFSFDFAGVDWYNSQGSTGLRLGVLDQSFFLRSPWDYCCDGFLGVVSDTEFTSLTFTFAGQGLFDRFEIGRISYAILPLDPTVVPVPPGLPLLAGGLLLLAALRKPMAKRTHRNLSS